MGLDATVYRSKKNLPFDADQLGASLDDATGEVYFTDSALDRKYSTLCKAVHRRLGNIAEISALRDEAAQVLEPTSLMLTKVLYSGTHGGDTIPAREIDKLQRELSTLREYAESSGTEVFREFLGKMEELVAAAKAQHNPIVF